MTEKTPSVSPSRFNLFCEQFPLAWWHFEIFQRHAATRLYCLQDPTVFAKGKKLYRLFRFVAKHTKRKVDCGPSDATLYRGGSNVVKGGEERLIRSSYPDKSALPNTLSRNLACLYNVKTHQCHATRNVANDDQWNPETTIAGRLKFTKSLNNLKKNTPFGHCAGIIRNTYKAPTPRVWKGKWSQVALLNQARLFSNSMMMGRQTEKTHTDFCFAENSAWERTLCPATAYPGFF